MKLNNKNLPWFYQGVKGKLLFISDLCYDYDGFRDADNLMGLIDEIREIAIQAREELETIECAPVTQRIECLASNQEVGSSNLLRCTKNKEVAMNQQDIDKLIESLEEEIEEYLAESLRLEIGDAVQLLNDYIYIEFWDRRGHEWKCRIKYPVDAVNALEFYKMPQDKQRIFILEEIIKTTLSEW